jgi:hypothetical protein
MIDLQHAFRTDAVSLGDIVGIFSGDGDPSLEDINEAPIGSIFLRSNGQAYRKVAQPAKWAGLFSSVHDLLAIDGGVVPFLMVPDPTVPGRLISVNTNDYSFFAGSLNRESFLNAGPGDSGIEEYVMPFDGVCFGFMLHADKVDKHDRNVCLMINGVSSECIQLPKQHEPQIQSRFGLDFPFNRGDILQIQDQSGSESGKGKAKLVRGIVHVRWRSEP